MKILGLKRYVLFLLSMGLVFFTLANARESGGYDLLSYDLMKCICGSKPELAEGGMPVCTSCSEVSVLRSASTESFSSSSSCLS